MRTLIGLLVGLWLGLLTQSAGAQVSAGCAPGETPRYVFGFADLAAQLGEVMGAPVSCEYADPNGSGDTLQDTSTGLAFWRKSTNTPTFTDGATHWGLTPAGLVAWTGPSIDPPGLAVAPPSPPSPPSAPSPPVAPPPAPVTPLPPVPAPPIATPPTASPPLVSPTCGAPANPWGFTFCGGTPIVSPPAGFCSVFTCIATFASQTNGYVVQCQDGLLSHSGGVRGSCWMHGGERRILYAP